MSQSPVKPLTAEERAELRRVNVEQATLVDFAGYPAGANCSAITLLALLDALDEATARAERYREALSDAESNLRMVSGWLDEYPSTAEEVSGFAYAARAALAAEHDTKEDGDGE